MGPMILHILNAYQTLNRRLCQELHKLHGDFWKTSICHSGYLHSNL